MSRLAYRVTESSRAQASEGRQAFQHALSHRAASEETALLAESYRKWMTMPVEKRKLFW
jgi:hypothetical protein